MTEGMKLLWIWQYQFCYVGSNCIL